MSWSRQTRAPVFRPVPAALAAAALLFLVSSESPAQVAEVRVEKDAAGSRLQVDGRDFMVFGMNWGYMPIGENYLYSLWEQSDDVIETALEREMSLLQDMGVNVIRQYTGIPPRWVQHIYERYGIYTVLNHTVARYGYTLDGVWIPSVDYSDPRLREAVTAEVLAIVDEFRDTPGVLMWLLGNENNYGLSWSSFEIEALPEGERNAARARHLYSLFGEITDAIHARDSLRPVAIANGDVQYIDLIAEECKGLDIFGTNVYRGISARDLFEVVDEKLGIPVMFTEFGSDAFNAREMREDQRMQARYLIGQWQEIYEQSHGKGRVGNAIGGIIFQWSDGWWKFRQEINLDIHDTNASWPNGGYVEDYVAGENNMNEEWFGICAKGKSDALGLYEVYPRAAYYALRRAFTLDPYAPATDIGMIRDHFATINPSACMLEARGDRAALGADVIDRVRLSGVRMEFETYSTGGRNIETPPADAPRVPLPSYRGFDHMQSFYTDFQVRPTEAVTGNLSLNILGNVAANPIDEIFYENRGIRGTFVSDQGETFSLQGLERVKVYSANVTWDDRWFKLDGFYRSGHTHWGYEGDFFHLYREAYYGENVDIYNGEAPIGVEVAGRKWMQGLRIAFGPQVWWGANPMFMAKYQRRIGAFDTAALFQEEFAKQSSLNSSIAVPLPPTRRASLQVGTKRGPWQLQVGGLWAGSTKKGEIYQVIVEDGMGSYRVLVDKVEDTDALGGRAKITFESGRWRWYGQAARFGRVADSGPNPMVTFTGWVLKDSGWSNQTNVLSGLAVNLGKFQIAPNVLWQKPLEGPIPGDVPAPGRPRNVLDDPFAVRANREMFAAEMMFTYDPTPADWMWAWDNDKRESARFAWSLGLIYWDLKTTMDAAIGILEDGFTTFAFPGATPPRELWEARARFVSRLSRNTRLVAHIYAGTGEPNGDDTRLIHRYGGDARITWSRVALAGFLKVNDWGPFDYHRDGNLTFPVHTMADISYTLGRPRWFGFPQTKMGIRTTWRTLDEFSNRYCPGVGTDGECDPLLPGDNGMEWEIRTYLHLAI